MIDFKNKAIFKLKRNSAYQEKVAPVLLDGERIIEAFSSMRDGVVFTDRRVIAANVQGLTGRKIDFTSLPYKNVIAFSVESAGTADLDSELELYFSGLGKVTFEFTAGTNVFKMAQVIGNFIL